MLETMREFAAERLAEVPEAARVRQAHAAAYLELAEQAARELSGPREEEWLVRLDLEHDNLRAAGDLLMQASPPEALRLAAALHRFWSVHGHFGEGRARLQACLRHTSEAGSTRVEALNGAGWLAIDQGDYAEAAGLLEASGAASRALQDARGEGRALSYLCRCMIARLDL